MQPKPHNDRASELSEVLGEWRVEATLPPRFQEGVWRQIARTQVVQHAPGGWWTTLLLRWEKLVHRPVGVAACLTFFTALGIGFGLWHAQAYAKHTQSAWQNAYFQSVSPTSVTSDP
jgi:hypothetical protein